MSSSVASSSFPEELSSKNYFTSKASEEDNTEKKENIEEPIQGSISISNCPINNFVHNLCLQCSYVIASLNLEIKQITKENFSLKDKLTFKAGMEKSYSPTSLKQLSKIKLGSSDSFLQNNNKNSFRNKHHLSIKLPIQEQTIYSKRILTLPMTNFFKTVNKENLKNPLLSIVTTSIFSKPNSVRQEEKHLFNSLLNNSIEKNEQTVLKHSIVINSQSRLIEEHQEIKNCYEKDSQGKNKEKEQGQQNSKDEQEKEKKIKLINTLAKHKNLSSKLQENLTSHFQEIDSFFKENISNLSGLNTNEKQFLQYALQTSILSQIFDMRISNLDVLILFIEVMKLALKSRQQQHLFRNEERLLQLSHMKEIVASYKDQANSLLFSGLASGLLAVFSGVAPIFGCIKGEWTLIHLSKIFSSLKDMESEKFFENVSKITLATSEMAKATGQIQTAFNEGHRTYDDYYKESYKIDADDRSRAIEEIKDNWRSLESFLYQCLQMQHDTIKQLYQ